MSTRNLSFMAMLAAAIGGMPLVDDPKAVNTDSVRRPRGALGFPRGCNKGTRASRNSLPKHIQQQKIAAAKDKREKRAQLRLLNAIKRDAGYYRCSPQTNPNFSRAMFTGGVEVAA